MLSYVCALLTWACALAAPTTTSVDLLMPEVQPLKPDTYLCRSIDVSELEPYITGFIPNANMDIAHHMLLYGCTEPGSQQPVWNCGEMAAAKSDYDLGPVCASGSKILYAWAMDAPSLKLPKDVAFKLGGDTGIKKLTLQVHYKNVSSFLPPENKKDSSGITLLTTNKPKGRRAGVYLMVTAGHIPAHSIEYMEAACDFPDADVEIHPFAFRTHAHSLGRVVSGYRVRDGQWLEIGRQDPRKPEMFYNATTPNLTVRKGDILAARCTMENNLDHDVAVGATQNDEMCNFYIMYFVDGEKTPSRNTCFSPGPPNWYLEDYPNQAALNVAGMPATASTEPGTGKTYVATTQTQQEAQADLGTGEQGEEVEDEEESPEVDELLDNYLAGMYPGEVESLVSQMLRDQEEVPPEAPARLLSPARRAMRQRQMADAYGFYYPDDTQ